ncbi:hypothetical protein [Bifidobacterium sp.]|jgi:hypothetical protein|uniref:hypothetical protein n=1 Tax=Bifidobacterium sp. TaxID=41200 RepID=UPI0025BAB0CF|nr:hypothetical protein [Bifidobacterium sp.]MCH4209410.1 hypothetical protein [Bifidobacterium sp.]
MAFQAPKAAGGYRIALPAAAIICLAAGIRHRDHQESQIRQAAACQCVTDMGHNQYAKEHLT